MGGAAATQGQHAAEKYGVVGRTGHCTSAAAAPLGVKIGGQQEAACRSPYLDGGYGDGKYD